VACVAQTAGGDHVGFSRRGGAEMGIPTMDGKESAGTSRVKAAIITTQSDSSP
jgi:ethanolamine transporter EutH